MPWFRVDDAAAFHPKIVKAGNAAIGAWVRLGAYCNAYHLNGKVETSAALDIGSQEEIDSLVAVGLLHAVDGGYEIHDYLKYQSSKEAIEAKKEETRKRVAEHRRRNKAGTPDVTSDVTAYIDRSNAVSTRNVPDGMGSEDSSEKPDRVDGRSLQIAWSKISSGGMPNLSGLLEALNSIPAEISLPPNPAAAFCAATVKYVEAYLEHKQVKIPLHPDRITDLKHFGNIVEVMLGKFDVGKMAGRRPNGQPEPHRPRLQTVEELRAKRAAAASE